LEGSSQFGCSGDMGRIGDRHAPGEVPRVFTNELALMADADLLQVGVDIDESTNHARVG